MPRISDRNIDLHGQNKLLIFLIQSKWLNPKSKILVKDLREFLHTISNQPKTSVGFLVSSVELGDNARIELENSPIKERICVCFYYEIVDKIFEYARVLKEKQDKLLKSKLKKGKEKPMSLKLRTNLFENKIKESKKNFKVKLKNLKAKLLISKKRLKFKIRTLRKRLITNSENLKNKIKK
ncbi:hypothetical protein F8M41_026122 [Gigaspora margarita]|uniref:Uncharacterized protein n=1 Tax=Gigaspora margarita TaxID=4874 RepID=A0A8H4AZU9_GIGMA|nr:hypothetical protein F8M41_026122 [Gigaspora margarita]